MPLNTLRLNHTPSSHPNDRIVFIKPLPRPQNKSQDYETADLILRAIAAQCLPIMKKHYLSVTTLEEHEPNPEFIGRNFNNGEVIQLVLQSQGKQRRWLSIPTIQMVMMHELAHNMHMNHGRDFWKTRNLFAAEMKDLWTRGYTGDGLWGSGRILGQLEDGLRDRTAAVGSQELKDLPVCGGTFRSRGGRKRRGRKRKAKAGEGEELTWREKKERRMEKKFGKNGIALGEDEDKRLNLEVLGKGPIGIKPRVAQSKRGRELRAAAALARFSTNKKEAELINGVKQEDPTSEEESTEEEYENGDDGDDDQEDAKDLNGERLLDKQGRGMIKVCGDEDGDDIYVKQEMNELDNLDWSTFTRHDDDDNDSKDQRNSKDLTSRSASRSKDQHTSSLSQNRNQTFNCNPSPNPNPNPNRKTNNKRSSDRPSKNTQQADTRIDDKSKPESKQSLHSSSTSVEGSTPDLATTVTSTTTTTTRRAPAHTPAPAPTSSLSHTPPPPPPSLSSTQCPICTTLNPPLSTTCTTCAHVLDPRKDPRCWQCTSSTCASQRASPHEDVNNENDDSGGGGVVGGKTTYMNAGDCGVCGLCGERRG